ncbi:MAG: nitroreductase family protein [Spirochaetes bacterium]|nr:nitroreductase family protein [Spirochaetota bacterium]
METIEAIKTRRAINFFDSSRQIPADEIIKLLDVASLAPSSSNLQPWEAVLVDDPARKAALRKCAYNQAKVEEASAVLIVIANPGGLEEHIDRVMADRVEKGYMMKEDIEKQRQGPFKMYKEKESETRKLFAVKNAAFFAMNFMIAARGFGYETHPMDGFNAEEVKREFNIPNDRIIPVLIAVGYARPDLALKPRPFRYAAGDFVRMNDYRAG